MSCDAKASFFRILFCKRMRKHLKVTGNPKGLPSFSEIIFAVLSRAPYSLIHGLYGAETLHKSQNMWSARNTVVCGGKIKSGELTLERISVSP